MLGSLSSTVVVVGLGDGVGAEAGGGGVGVGEGAGDPFARVRFPNPSLLQSKVPTVPRNTATSTNATHTYPRRKLAKHAATWTTAATINSAAAHNCVFISKWREPMHNLRDDRNSGELRQDPFSLSTEAR